MRCTLRIGILGICLSTFTALGAPPERTLPVDPVDLAAGREVPGKADLEVEHEGYAYRFATPEHKQAFEKAPSKYAAADGGACGRMGPLSGLGDARRFSVHGGRLYFFASDGCRAGFLKDPAKYIESDDEKIVGSNDQVLKGRAVMDRLVASCGGADALKGLTAIRIVRTREESRDGDVVRVVQETVLSFDGHASQKESRNDSWYSTVRSPAGAAMGSPRGIEAIASSRGRAFDRLLARVPVVILKAYVDGVPADCPGLIVVWDGEGVVGESPVDFVRVWLNGAASRLAVHRDTGALLEVSFRGRDRSQTIGDSARRYTGSWRVGGLTLPGEYTLTFNGKPQPLPDWSRTEVVANPALPPDQFKVRG